MAKKDKKDSMTGTSFDDIQGMFEKKWGEGSLMSLEDNYKVKCEVIPSQSLSLDAAIGVGGFPRGRIIEIYGPEASGKTTLALHAVASAQKLGGKAAFIDAEHALSPTLMVDMGIDPKEVLISQPDSGEQALEMCELLVESNAVDIVVVDSVAALVPLAELEGDVNENKIGAQARMMSQFLRRIAAKIKKAKTSVVFINQIRNKIGVLFGSNETTPGGNALKFYASVRLDIRRRQQIKDGDNIIGHEARIKVVKNKVAAPFKVCDVPLMYGKGIDYIGDMVNAATKAGIIAKSGSWLSFNNERLGMGIQNATETLRENSKLTKKIEEATRKFLFPDFEDKNTEELSINSKEVSEDSEELSAENHEETELED